MLFFRQLQHLLPTGKAWRVVIDKLLRRFFLGLAGFHEYVRDYIDMVYEDRLPESTREIAGWEKQFGIYAAPTIPARRQQIDAAWKATGGQSKHYLQTVLQAAGFDVFVYDAFHYPLGTRAVRDPTPYTAIPLVGTTQCGRNTSRCGGRSARCNSFLANEIGYLWNDRLANVAPPPIPSNTAYWPLLAYVGGEPFGTLASVPSARRKEFERLIYKHFPTHLWVVTLVSYSDGGGVGGGGGGDLLNDQGEQLFNDQGELLT